MRARKVGRYGNTDVIKLKSYDKEDLGLKYDDEVDIEGIKKVKSSRKWSLKNPLNIKKRKNGNATVK